MVNTSFFKNRGLPILNEIKEYQDNNTPVLRIAPDMYAVKKTMLNILLIIGFQAGTSIGGNRQCLRIGTYKTA